MIDAAADDLREVLDTAMARGSYLLTAGEVYVVRTILGLESEPLRLYARLTARVPEVFPRDAIAPFAGVDAPEEAMDALCAAELADTLVSWSARAEHATKDELAAACRGLGLPVGGRHADLVARLSGRRGWSSRRWFRVRHRALLRRLEVWYFGSLFRDRSEFVVERLGHRRWPQYTPSGGGWFADRRAFRRWEQRIEALSTASDEELLGDLRATGDAPGRLALAHRARREIGGRAKAYESTGELALAERLWSALAGLGDGDAVLRWARVVERSGRGETALDILRSHRDSVDAATRLGIVRAGRRLARTLGSGFPPDVPLREPRERSVALRSDGVVGARPGWSAGEGRGPVEAAVRALLRAVGRDALFAEGELWSTLFGVLFRDVLFAPVPGALPTARLSAPLDFGRPEFAARRAAGFAAAWAEIDEDRGLRRVQRFFEHHAGERVAGVHAERFSQPILERVLQATPPALLRTLLHPVATHGLGAVGGLPDLFVLPGPAASLPGAFPSRLGEGAVFVEVKGPTDAMRDTQRIWADRLLDAGAVVETWNIRPDGPAPAQ